MTRRDSTGNTGHINWPTHLNDSQEGGMWVYAFVTTADAHNFEACCGPSGTLALPMPDVISHDPGRVSTQGVLRTRYGVQDGNHRSGLAAAIDTLIADAHKLGITFKAPCSDTPNLYMHGDGEHSDTEYPDGWRDLINAEADRIGWNSPYRPLHTKES